MVDERYIVVFDGVCNFCNGAVNFIIARDKDALFYFSPMQSDFAQNLIAQHNISRVGMDTFLLVKNGQCHVYTNAALEIAKDLSGAWFLFGVFEIIPTPVRDFFYKLFARNRYALFGRKDLCMAPSQALKARFIGI